MIGVDLDDVIVDFNTGLGEYHNNTYGTSYKREDIVSYELRHLWGCPHEEVIRRVYDFYYSSHHTNLLPIKGAVEALERLRSENTLVIITSRPESVKGLTLTWLDKHFPQVFEEIHFLGHYHGTEARKETKGEVCKKIGVEVFIDDSLEHAASVSGQGIDVLLFNAPWNQEGMPANTTRVFNWDDVLEKLLTP